MIGAAYLVADLPDPGIPGLLRGAAVLFRRHLAADRGVASRWTRWRRCTAICWRISTKGCEEGEAEGCAAALRLKTPAPGGGPNHVRGNVDEDDPAGAAGRRQGHAGRAPRRAARDPAALDRRHAARGGRRRHADRPQGEGRHGVRASSSRTRSWSASSPTGSRSRTRGKGFILDGFPAHGRPGRGARRRCSPQKGLKLDAVVEFKVDEEALVERIVKRAPRDRGARRADPQGRQSGGLQDPPRRLPGTDRAAVGVLRRQGHPADRRRHEADRRRDRRGRQGFLAAARGLDASSRAR